MDNVNTFIVHHESLLNYRGYTGRCYYNPRYGIFEVMLLFVKGSPYFQTEKPDNVEPSFRAMVDRYIDEHEGNGKYSTEIKVNVNPSLKDKAMETAKSQGCSLDMFTSMALIKAIEDISNPDQ